MTLGNEQAVCAWSLANRKSRKRSWSSTNERGSTPLCTTCNDVKGQRSGHLLQPYTPIWIILANDGRRFAVRFTRLLNRLLEIFRSRYYHPARGRGLSWPGHRVYVDNVHG